MPNTALWNAIAAYLYILHLDDLGLAWECLRRNPHYRAAWDRGDLASPSLFGLAAFEDPDRDARCAEPLWHHDAAALMVIPLTPRDLDGHAAPEPVFDLWALPGPRRLLHDGRAVRAMIGQRGQVRVRLARSLHHGRPFAYQLPPGAAAATLRRHAVQTIAEIERLPTPRPATKPQRDAQIAMRTFAAFDGDRAGASQRMIAAALFGEAAVGARWSHDGELRAQVRHLIRRGRKLVDGGYRTLLGDGGD